MKTFIERLYTSRVLWKQLVLTVITVVLGILVMTGTIDEAIESEGLELATYIVSGVISVITAIYSLYSGGNNPTDTESY